jgi:hypothetical protein
LIISNYIELKNNHQKGGYSFAILRTLSSCPRFIDTHIPLLIVLSLAMAGQLLKVLTDCQTNYCGNRGYAHDKKRTDSPKREFCPKSKRIHPSTVWACICTRTKGIKSIGNLKFFLQLISCLYPKRNMQKAD